MKTSKRDRVRAWLVAYKLAHGCAECGPEVAHHPDALTFDHRDERAKEFNISAFSSYSMGKLEAEVAKCDVLCANHHAIRTAARNRMMNAGELPRPNADAVRKKR